MEWIIIPGIVWHLGGILGLLVAWRHHEYKLKVGLISPVDLLNPSGIRWYLYAVPADSEVCSFCREAHGTAFLGGAVTRPGFTPLACPCTTPDKCFGMLLAFSGGWLEANDLMAQLRAAKTERRRLAPDELNRLIGSEWEPDGGKLDRTEVHLLSGYLRECSHPLQAIRSYGAALEQATLPRDQALLMSVYLRLAGVLARRGNPREAIQVIEHFEKRVARADAGTFTPTGKQRRALSTMKPYLYALIHQHADNLSKPATINCSDEDHTAGPTSSTGWPIRQAREA
jgi:hypothetical protein